MDPINLDDFETLARELMPAALWDTFAQGSEDEVTLHANRAAYAGIWLRPRVLADVRVCDTSTTALGMRVALPVLIAPTSVHGAVHPDGECATARASHAAGTIMVASTLSSASLEAIAAASEAAALLWFQLYLYRDRQFNEQLLARVERAGYRALVLTVDAPAIGNRERDRRNAFVLPGDHPFGNFVPAAPECASEVAAAMTWHTRGERAPLTWDVIAWLRARTHLPLVLKGVVTAEDALRALDAGVSGIIVSNHGGRQLDGTLPTIAALPEVVAAVGGRCEVFVDGGIRRGTDVLKALALGAQGVLVGRPIIWGLAARGEAGVRAVLDILRDELLLAMRLAGRPSIASIDSSLVTSARGSLGGRAARPQRAPQHAGAAARRGGRSA
ncbi:MAG: alpha-hydroxy acid oxidase [Ktedonobacterales bacterium]